MKLQGHCSGIAQESKQLFASETAEQTITDAEGYKPKKNITLSTGPEASCTGDRTACADVRVRRESVERNHDSMNFVTQASWKDVCRFVCMRLQRQLSGAVRASPLPQRRSSPHLQGPGLQAQKTAQLVPMSGQGGRAWAGS
jgi:hypothetical protein